MEGTGGRNPPLLLPPNFVPSTRLPDDRSCSTEEKSDNRPVLPPNYVSLRELRERRLKEEQERERSRQGGKASEGADRRQRHPSGYITVRELEEELLREAKEKERKGNGDGRGGESGGDRAPRPRDYVSLREIQARRLKERKGKEKGYESGKIENKINSELCERARNLCSNESGWVWEPKLPAAAGSSSADVSSDQNGSPAPQISSKNKWKDAKMKKKKKKRNWKRDSGKDIHEPALNAEQSLEVTGVEVTLASKTPTKALEEVALSKNGNSTVRNAKGENKNINEASSRLAAGSVEVKRLNGTRSRRIRAHKGRSGVKNGEASLSGPCRNVVSASEVEKGFDGVKELKGKGKVVNISESIDRYASHEEAKAVHGVGVGDLIGSEIGGGEVKGRGRNVSLSESEIGDDRWRKWNQEAGSRGRGRPRAGRFSARPTERLGGGGGFVWVPKNGS